MNKKQLKKLYPFVAGMVLVTLVASGWVVKAFTVGGVEVPPVSIENVENFNLTIQGAGVQGGGMLSGGTRWENGISADSTSPTAGQVRGTTLTATGALTANTAVIAAGLTATDGGITVTAGDVSLPQEPILTGTTAVTVTSTQVTSTLTAAELCDYGSITVTPSTNTIGVYTLILPSTTTLAADCLTANGMIKSVRLLSITTSTIFTTPTDYTWSYSSSTVGAGLPSILADKPSVLTIWRYGTGDYRAILEADITG